MRGGLKWSELGKRIAVRSSGAAEALGAVNAAACAAGNRA